MGTSSNTAQETIIALQNFIVKRTVPLILDAGGNYESLGTGTLVKTSDRKLIITSQHGIKGRNLSDLACPASCKGGALLTLGQITAHYPSVEEVDIAIIDVTNSWIAGANSEDWSFFDETNLGTVTNSSSFIIVGYPVDLMSGNQNVISGPPIMVLTELLGAIPTSAVQPVQEGLDHFFHYGSKAVALDGSEVDTVRLQGVSGAVIWQYTQESLGQLWNPIANLQAVAIEIASKKDEYVRGNNIRYALDIIKLT